MSDLFFVSMTAGFHFNVNRIYETRSEIQASMIVVLGGVLLLGQAKLKCMFLYVLLWAAWVGLGCPGLPLGGGVEVWVGGALAVVP